jgi:hypothetical protein
VIDVSLNITLVAVSEYQASKGSVILVCIAYSTDCSVSVFSDTLSTVMLFAVCVPFKVGILTDEKLRV